MFRVSVYFSPLKSKGLGFGIDSIVLHFREREIHTRDARTHDTRLSLSATTFHHHRVVVVVVVVVWNEERRRKERTRGKPHAS